MSAFKSVVRRFAKSAITQVIDSNKRTRVPTTLAHAKRVLFLFDGHDPLVQKDFDAWASSNRHRDVHYFKLIDKDQSDAFGYTSKQTNFSDIPKAEVLVRCNRIQADLLILFNPSDHISLHYLAMAHGAGMKVMTQSSLPADADMVFDRAGNDLKSYLDELDLFMKNILI